MSDGLTHDECRQAAANFGIDLTCGECASLFYTGHSSAPHNDNCRTIPTLRKDVSQQMSDGMSPVAAVTHILAREGITPRNVLVMMLIDAVRDTTPAPRQTAIGMLTKILRSLDPSEAVDAWTVRSSRQIVEILSKRPEVRRVAELVDDEHLWCTLEGVIAGMLYRVCRGQDLNVVDNTTGQQVPDLRR